MLKVEDWTVISMEKSLSKRTIQSLIKIFSDRIWVLNIKNRNTSSADSNWLYDQPAFEDNQIKEINRRIRKLGVVLSETHKKVNALVCYRQVDAHTDDRINVRTNSVVFVTLHWHQWAHFIWGSGENKIDIPIEDWSIVIFDQNTEHQVKFPAGSKGLKFGLSFFVDFL